MHAGYEQQTSFGEIVIYISKGKGGADGIEVLFTVKKSVKDFQKERIFEFWWIFLKVKKDFGQWCMRLLGSEMPLVGR